MRQPLGRQGEGPLAAYARAYKERCEQEQRVAAIVLATGGDLPPPDKGGVKVYGLGDARQLRGIPAVGVKGGHGGAIRGT